MSIQILSTILIVGFFSLLQTAYSGPTAHLPVWDSEVVVRAQCPAIDISKAANVVYVSSSEGNDSNSGLSAKRPVRTLVHGYQILERGGWLLLKSGDWFEGHNQSLNGNYGSFQKEGLSETQPTVITSYGEGAMPVLAGDPQYPYIFFIRSSARQHITIMGLNFYNYKRDPSRKEFDPTVSAGTAIMMDYGVSDIEVCGNSIRFFSGGILAQSIDTVNRIHDIRIRNNNISHQWTASGNGHAQGMYLDHILNLTISGNTFLHNGWLDSNIVSGSQPTIFNHNFYLNSIENLTVEENIFAYGSSMCAKNRSDQAGGFKNVVYRRNLCLRSPIGYSFGGVVDASGGFQYENVVFEDNYYMERGNDHPGAQSIMWGFSAMPINNLVVRRNKFFNDVEFQNAFPIQVTLSSSPVQVYDNEIYNFRFLGLDIRGTGLAEIGQNFIQSQGQPLSVAQMDRTIANYNFAIGSSNDVEGFIEELEQQTYDHWRPAYTAPNIIHFLQTGTLSSVEGQ